MTEELRTKLWDLAYGLLDEAEAAELCAKISSDREVARSYARVKLQTELVAQAAKGTHASCETMPHLEPCLVSRSARRSRVGRVVATACSLALSLALLFYAGHLYLAAESPIRAPVALQAQESLAAAYPRLLVTGPSELQRGRSAEYQVMLTDMAAELPLASTVEARLENENGTVAWREEAVTNTNGRHLFVLPENLEEENYRFKVSVNREKSPVDPFETYQAAEMNTWLANTAPAPTLAAIDQVVTTSGDRLERRVYLEDESRKFPANELASSKLSEDKKSGPTNESTQIGKKDREFSLKERALTRKSSAVEWGLAKQQPSPLDSDAAVPPPATAPAPAEPAAPPPNVSTLSRDRAGLEQPEQYKSGARSSAGAQEATDSLALKQSASAHYFVEVEWDEYGVRNSRLIGAKDLGKTDLYGTNLATRVAKLPEGANNGVAILDYSQAPPQPLIREGRLEIPQPEPLSFEVEFDRAEYFPGDLANVQLQVHDAQGNPVEALLGVQVDAVPVQFADAPFELTHANRQWFTVSQQTLDTVPLPLVFDNAMQQHQQLSRSTAAWHTQRSVVRHHAALALLVGSGLGYCLLLVAALLKWLPSVRLWLPVVGLLFCSSILGVVFLVGGSATPVLTPPAALTSYGIHTQPPAPVEELEHLALTARAANGGDTQLPFASQNYFQSLPKQFSYRDLDESAEAKIAHYSLPQASDLALLATRQETTETENLPRLYSKNVQDLYDDLSSNAFTDLEYDRFDFGKHRTDEKFNGAELEFPAAETSRTESKSSNAGGTIYWHPELETSTKGLASFEFHVPSGPAAYRLVVRAQAGHEFGAIALPVPVCLPLPRE